MFAKALDFVLRWETGGTKDNNYKDGAYHNDPDDPGGETKWGISKKAYPELDISKITLHGAHEIYQRDYWSASKCQHMPPQFAMCVFDTAINIGNEKRNRYRTNRMIQKTVKASVDGIVGPKTLLAIDKYNSRAPNHLINKFLSKRIQYYKRLTKLNKYFEGWSRRVIDLALSL